MNKYSLLLMTLVFSMPTLNFSATLPAGVKAYTCLKQVSHCAAVGEKPISPPTCPANVCFKLIGYISDDWGRSWQPSNYIPTPSIYDNHLLFIACGDDGQICHAVGFTSPTSSIQHSPLILFSHDGGNHWLYGCFPEVFPDGMHDDSLNSVACDASGMFCTAVGSYYSNTQGEQIAPLSYYTTNGGYKWWLSQTLPAPQGKHSVLEKVTCDKITLKCTAIGYAINTDGIKMSIQYASIDGGKNWKLLSLNST